MNSRNFVVLGSSLLIAALVAVWGVQGEEPAATPPVAPPEIPAEKTSAAENSPTEPRQPDNQLGYPVLNDLELLERLTEAGVRMIEEGTGKGSKELNTGLACPIADLELAPVCEKPIADAELYSQACESIFVICGLFKVEGSEEWEAAFATAFAVSADGVLTTSRHFFDDPQLCDVVLVSDAAGKIYPVTEILCSEARMDTCLFRIPAKNLKPLPIAKHSPMPGSRVRIVSHPGYFFYFFSAGQVANYFKDETGLRWMNVTADFGQGSSGAPAFDECGNVVGQVSSTLTLYAVGGTPVEDPIVSRRRVTRSTDGRLQVTSLPCVAKPKANADAAEKPADSEDAPKKKRKKKKDKTPEMELKPVPAPDILSQIVSEEIADPQMVFKTCTPLESIREMVKKGH